MRDQTHPRPTRISEQNPNNNHYSSLSSSIHNALAYIFVRVHRLRSHGQINYGTIMKERTQTQPQINLTHASVPATVDFPTPPFPDATRITFLTPSIGFLLGNPLLISSFCLRSNSSLLNFWVDKGRPTVGGSNKDSPLLIVQFGP